MTPKLLFQRNAKNPDNWLSLARSDDFQVALSYALADTVHKFDCTQDQILGIKRFINVLLDLAEVEPEPPQYPEKRLIHEFSRASRQEPEKRP